MLVSKAKRLFIKSPDLWKNSCLKIMKDDHANSSAANYELNYEFAETDCNPSGKRYQGERASTPVAVCEANVPKSQKRGTSALIAKSEERAPQQPKARNERPNSQKLTQVSALKAKSEERAPQQPKAYEVSALIAKSLQSKQANT